MDVIGNNRGFVDYDRNPEAYRPPMERVTDWAELNAEPHDSVERIVQAARCMDCGTPFCQTHTGCPVNNLIPEFNSLVFQARGVNQSEPRRRRGCDVDSPWRRVAAPPRLRRG